MKTHQVQTPLLLGGDALTPFRLKIPQEELAQGWLLRHPAEAANLQHAFAKAGADVLCAPTGGLNPLSLAAADHFDQSEKLGKGIIALTIQSTGGTAKTAGIITSIGQQPEPFGLLPYTDLIDTYAEQALQLAAAGATYLVLHMGELGDARAGVLGARQADLPILVTFRVDHNGRTNSDRDVLAALVCLQELGISAFGVDSPDPFHLPQTVKRLAGYAKVPLMAVVHTDSIEPEDIQRPCFELLAAGARILQGGVGVTPGHLAVIRRVMDTFSYVDFPIDLVTGGPLLLADENRVHYLEEDCSLSQEITCNLDMSEAILEQEDEGIDAVVFAIGSIEDAYCFGQNAHLVSTPVCLLAQTEEALEMALLYYNGRAIIDARCTIDSQILHTLAQGYGAVIR